MIDKMINQMHLYEKKVLKAIGEAGGEALPEDVAEREDLNIKQVMSAAGALESKGIIEVEKDVDEFLSLGPSGADYAQEGLPERKILEALKKEKPSMMKDSHQIRINLQSKCHCWLLKKGWAPLNKAMSPSLRKVKKPWKNQELMKFSLKPSWIPVKC